MAILFLIVVLGSIALPLTAGFVGEFLMIAGIFQQSIWYAAVGGLTMILGAIYMLYAYQRAMLGDKKKVFENITDIGTLDYLILIPLIVLILGLGIYTQPIFNIFKPVVEAVMAMAH